MNEEFKFPDEQEPEEKDSAVEIEIVEGEKPKFTKLREEPKPLDDQEVKEYGERVRNRIDHLYKGYQSEKRRAEEAEKSREEAFRIAQAATEENKRLKGSLSENQAVLLEQAKKTVSKEVEDAKTKYKQAYEAGNSDELVNAQEELTAAKIKLDKVNNFRPNKEPPPEVEVPRSDQKAESWRSRNAWFGNDEEMTALVLAYHSKLVKQGVDTSSEEYYEKIDARMRQVFPDYFEPEEPRQRTKSNVAPATRSSAPTKVRLTTKQVEYAKRYKIPLERYAQEVAKLQRG